MRLPLRTWVRAFSDVPVPTDPRWAGQWGIHETTSRVGTNASPLHLACDDIRLERGRAKLVTALLTKSRQRSRFRACWARRLLPGMGARACRIGMVRNGSRDAAIAAFLLS